MGGGNGQFTRPLWAYRTVFRHHFCRRDGLGSVGHCARLALGGSTTGMVPGWRIFSAHGNIWRDIARLAYGHLLSYRKIDGCGRSFVAGSIG